LRPSAPGEILCSCDCEAGRESRQRRAGEIARSGNWWRKDWGRGVLEPSGAGTPHFRSDS
jgi:hypothetical protein